MLLYFFSKFFIQIHTLTKKNFKRKLFNVLLDDDDGGAV